MASSFARLLADPVVLGEFIEALAFSCDAIPSAPAPASSIAEIELRNELLRKYVPKVMSDLRAGLQSTTYSAVRHVLREERARYELHRIHARHGRWWACSMQTIKEHVVISIKQVVRCCRRSDPLKALVLPLSESLLASIVQQCAEQETLMRLGPELITSAVSLAAIVHSVCGAQQQQQQQPFLTMLPLVTAVGHHTADRQVAARVDPPRAGEVLWGIRSEQPIAKCR